MSNIKNPLHNLRDVISLEFNKRWVAANYGEHKSPVIILEEVLDDMGTYSGGVLQHCCPVCGGFMCLNKDCDTYYFECHEECCVSTPSADSPMNAYFKLINMKCYQKDWSE